MIAAIAGMAVVIVLLVALLLTGGSGDSGAGPTSPSSNSGQAAEAGSGDAGAVDFEVQKRRLENQKAATRIALLLDRSAEGRRRTMDGNFSGALANRESIKASLESVTSARGAIERARLKFIAAMEASIGSNRSKLNGLDGSSYDYRATDLKIELEAIWNHQVAPRFDLDPVSAGSI